MDNYNVFVIFVLYIALCIYCSFRKKSSKLQPDITQEFSDFSVAGRSQSAMRIGLSLLATMLGASATFGVVGLASKEGIVALLWLGIAAVGVFLQSIFLVRPLRRLACHSLPDAVSRYVGKSGQRLSAGLIIVPWLGVVAAQFVGLKMLLQSVLDADFAQQSILGLTVTNDTLLCVILAILVIAYTAIGGQRAVIRTDCLQAGLLYVALIAIVIYIYPQAVDSVKNTSELLTIQSNWTIWDSLRLVILLGSAYFVGPDLATRFCSSRDEKSAVRAGLGAAAGLLVASVLLTLIGLAIRHIVPDNDITLVTQSPFAYLLNPTHEILPLWLVWLTVIGLTGALLSSADSCLLGIAILLEHDLLLRQRVAQTRLWVVILGLLSLIIALLDSDIISLLLRSYALYVPALVCPVAVLLLRQPETVVVKRWLWLTAVVTGALCGLAGEISVFWQIPPPWSQPGLALLGVLLSLGLSLASVRSQI